MLITRFLLPSSRLIGCFIAAVLLSINAIGQTQGAASFPPSQMEHLDRGLIAVKTQSGVYLSWRSLATDPVDTYFKIYKDKKLYKTTTATSPTCLSDDAGTLSTVYSVEAYAGDKLFDTSKQVKAWAEPYKAIKLQRPAGGVTPRGDTYTYAPNDCSAADLNGDGQYEIILKWDPSNSKDNAHSGYTGSVIIDGYTLDGALLWRIDLGKNIRAGAHYTQFMVYDFDGDGRAEMACKTAPGSKDGLGNYVQAVNNDADYRNGRGFILQGEEYLTMFDGLTGEAKSTVPYEPARGIVDDWGDDEGNRVDRFLACVAYLDGQHPSLVMCRGYYTRSTLAAYDYRDGKLIKRWLYDSGTTRSATNIYGQGNHNLSVADVDGDGKDEIIYGAGAIDDDGAFLYNTRLGHGDAMHLSDIDPDRPGLEVFTVHESRNAPYGYELHDAATGEIIFGARTGSDNGRGLAADIDKNHRGLEMWSIHAEGIWDCKGNKIAASVPESNNSRMINYRIYWDGDLQDELLDGDKLCKWTPDSTIRLATFGSLYGVRTNNGTKNNPCLQADLFGDWREEIVYYCNVDDPSLYIITTTIPTPHRLYTLMHDRVYREAIAWQNTVYNQPPHLGFYIGDGVSNVPRPNIHTPVYTPPTD